MAARLKGKRAIVTGGGTGIGKAIAKGFLAEGASVVICGRRHGPLNSMVEDAKTEFQNIHFIECDISDPSDIDSMVKSAVEKLGGLDIVVNNAGIVEGGTLETTPEKIWDRVMSINLRGPYLLTKAAMPHLKESGRGSNVLNIGSNVGNQGVEDLMVYSISKAGLEMFTRTCALDYADDGIRFNTIAPGVVDTPMQDRNKGELGYQEWRHQMEQMHPLKSIGRPEDIARVAVFICSSDADWITGETIHVDGGLGAR
ncbi:MAG: SDR family NAD(P)-dependent oxidoreductase [Planctomycetota bacterium]|jgi:meso-butanediol dehydrogenase/(S,S)-butanediol dehydrogenase/diacetyl reductase